jgi:hypothetical protein
MTPSRRALTEQRRQRRTLVETSAMTDSQGQSHPRGERGARRHKGWESNQREHKVMPGLAGAIQEGK